MMIIFMIILIILNKKINNKWVKVKSKNEFLNNDIAYILRGKNKIKIQISLIDYNIIKKGKYRLLKKFIKIIKN